MSKWEMVRLGDVCDINMGQSPSSESYNQEKKGLPFYQGNADFGEINPIVRYYCNEPTKIANKDDVLLSVRAPIGALNIAKEKCCIGRGLAAITQKHNITNFKYIFFVLKHKHGELNSKGTGSTFKAINKQTLVNTIIPLPPLETQKHIAKTLDTASEVITLHKQQLAELDSLIKSIFYDMFGDPVVNDMGWEVRKLEEVINTLTDYHANGSYESLRDNVTLLDQPNYALMIRTTDLEKGNFIDNVKYIDEHAYNHLSKSKVFGGEIIINKIGSAGKIYLMPFLNRPVSLAMNQFLLRFNNLTNPIYIFNFLKTEFSEKNIAERVQGAVTKTITKDAIKSLPFILPPLPLQQKFSDIVTKIEEQKNIVKKAIDESQYLFDSLMSEYFE